MGAKAVVFCQEIRNNRIKSFDFDTGVSGGKTPVYSGTGETKTNTCIAPNIAASTHAPAWGATHLDRSVRLPENDFNPRSRMGSDTIFHPIVWYQIQISTHAPAWGATRHLKPIRSGSSHFNPRSRMGSDSNMIMRPIFAQISTHAPAWGATINHAITKCNIFLFQPTLPHGERLV